MGAAADTRWEAYLWEQHDAVALRVAEVEDLEPLAVLVKVQSKKKRNGFTIRKVGSLSSLRNDHSGDESSDLRWRKFEERWRTSAATVAKALASRTRSAPRATGALKEVLELKSGREITFEDASSTSCLFSVVAASCGFERCRRLEARAQGVRSVSLSPHDTMPLFTAESPTWKPDLTKLQQLVSWDDLPR